MSQGSCGVIAAKGPLRPMEVRGLAEAEFVFVQGGGQETQTDFCDLDTNAHCEMTCECAWVQKVKAIQIQ